MLQILAIAKEKAPRKVWLAVTKRTIVFLDRETCDEVEAIPLLDIETARMPASRVFSGTYAVIAVDHERELERCFVVKIKLQQALAQVHKTVAAVGSSFVFAPVPRPRCRCTAPPTT
jgi:hypothetical protein